MGFRFHKSIGLGKFLRLNISKSGIGFSAGIPGLRVSTGPQGAYFTAGLPGTGLSYRKKLNTAAKGDRSAASAKTKTQAEASPDVPSPGFFAPRHEKELAKGLKAYEAGQADEALEHFLAAADDEPGAAILAATILTEREDGNSFKAIELLEKVVQSDGEFPTPLMEKYLASTEIEINVTPHVTVAVPVDGLAATLLLVELYQSTRRVREAIALLEEVTELANQPVLILSLCELYASREIWEGIIDRAQGIEPVDDVTVEIAIYYGRAMQERELHDAAISVFSKALSKKKDRNPELLREAAYWRAISYQAQGKHSQARKEFEKLYAEAPNFRDVSQRLANFSVR
jgi:tetratricopeptide (TPR) repeat protein